MLHFIQITFSAALPADVRAKLIAALDQEAGELLRDKNQGIPDSLDGRTIVMVEHVMHAIRSLCRHIVVLNAGKVIASGAPQEALANRDVIRVYLGDAL